MTTAPHRALVFGVRFNPTAEEAVALYLRRRIVGEQLPDVAGIIHEADVYKVEPKELAAAYPRLPRTQNRFFFTTCKRKKAGKGYRMSRAAGGPGSWVASGDKKDVENGAGETIGYRETLKYAYRDKSRKSDWRMDEYHCCGLDGLAVVNGEERIFCRVYVLPNSMPGSVTLQESAAGDRLLGMQEPSSAMAAAAQQKQQMPRGEPATTMAVQQQPPRRQEPVTPVLPSIAQPQPIKKTPPPRALGLPSVLRQPCVTETQQEPKRPAPQVVEPPRPKRMRPTLAPLEVPPVPRHDVVAMNTPERPSWFPPASATPQRQARASPTAAPRRRPRNSSRSHPVAPPPPPTDEAPTNGNDDWSSFVAELNSSISQEEAVNDDKLARLPEPEMASAEDHAMIQEEAGNDDDESLAEWLESQIEEIPAVEGKIQEEEGQHARSLEGLVADERGDDVTAQDLWDTLDNFDDGNGDTTDWTLPLSAYGDIQY